MPPCHLSVDVAASLLLLRVNLVAFLSSGPMWVPLLQVNMIASLSVLELYVLVALFRIKRQGKDSCTFEMVTSTRSASNCTVWYRLVHLKNRCTLEACRACL